MPETRRLPSGDSAEEVLAHAVGALSVEVADARSTALARSSTSVPATRVVTYAELAAEHVDYTDLAGAFGTYAQVAAHKTFGA